jgi:tRNA pseudouridine38-40 synthase
MSDGGASVPAVEAAAEPAAAPTPRRVLFTIEYDGTDFAGWQLQTNGRSVQGVLEDTLARITGSPVRVHGAGRTDAGVHATGQCAHADLATRLDPPLLARAMNAHLPYDVVVRDAREVAPDLHARFSASSRAYAYTVSHVRTALHRRDTWFVPRRLDHDLVRAACATLYGTHDYTLIGKSVPSQIHGWCHIFECTWEEGEERSVFRIRANRFLYGMVRSLMGALVEIGTHRQPVDAIASVRDGSERKRLAGLAPAKGLVLTSVRYDPAERLTGRWASP